MPKSCAARQCCNRYSNRRKQLTFHRFPFSRPELLKEWVLNIGRGDFEPKQHTVICSEHFRPECFSAFGNRKNLKHNAVPTVFAFQGPSQLVRENTDPAGPSGDAASEKGKVLPETGAGEGGPGRKVDATLEVLQLPPDAGGPGAQVRPGQVRRQHVAGLSSRGFASNRRKKTCLNQSTRTCSLDSDLTRELSCDWAALGFGRAWGSASCRPGLCLSLTDLCPQVPPHRPEATGVPGQPASPTQPSDHSYALLDLDALKKKLFLTLKENEKLRRRLKAQRLVMRKMSSRLRACGVGQPGLQARLWPGQQS
ncbi:THAP domain-containing protein 3 isoform X1 [Eubalaena glacialis]|uniref:THAP domain-containing protein 3 isoform X1 n=1 Tax=Eubalaena glacialis TaxID=27606 RepID=UPI002A5A7B2D|nr:THAP domain-containing protein 3 isoform X1 [Eubalaena glacialis]